MSITDSDDVGIDAVYIQISSGYVNGQDVLTLVGSHPTITSTWNVTSGKLTLSGVSGIQPTYINLINAIQDVQFSSTAANPTGTKTFSITVGQANYLPSNGHYYQYIPNIGISWTTAKTAAATSTYYGLQGYLATITTAEEAQISGEQASGAGWIGGSDEQTEGVWKWMTGPETGITFWNGLANGSSPTFAFWNTAEPNNLGNENYAHVTAPGVGIAGSWNDLSNIGGASGNYQPKGYIVEYGGMPGDPVLQISTSTTISFSEITNTVNGFSCGSGTVQLSATALNGTVNWFQNQSGGTSIASGDTFITPNLAATTIYYVEAISTACTSGLRVPITALINEIPVVSINNVNSICGSGITTITATTAVGNITWYATLTAGSLLGTGGSFTTSLLNQTTTYYAEGINNGCISARIPITVIVYPLPLVTDETETFCENTAVILDAGVSNATYLWSTGATSQTISVNSSGIYTVAVTSLSPENCAKTKTIIVNETTFPVIEEVLINGSTVTIISSGNGVFEYSVDGLNYQDSTIFTLEEGGKYRAYVRSKNNCGNDYEDFILVTIPSFFTPNDDGTNDSWFVKGMLYYPKANLRIFDRFGKLVGVVNANNNSWDGNYEGTKLPSTDYWYVLKIDDSMPEKRGHFAMKR